MTNKPDATPPGGELLLYQADDGRTRVEYRFDEGTLWLTQAQIADLFQITPQNVTIHLKAISAEGELNEAATCKDYLQVRQEGTRQVSRSLRHYRLEAILAVGYRARIAQAEYDRFAERRRALAESEGEKTLRELEEKAKKLPKRT